MSETPEIIECPVYPPFRSDLERKIFQVIDHVYSSNRWFLVRLADELNLDTTYLPLYRTVLCLERNSQISQFYSYSGASTPLELLNWMIETQSLYSLGQLMKSMGVTREDTNSDSMHLRAFLLMFDVLDFSDLMRAVVKITPDFLSGSPESVPTERAEVRRVLGKITMGSLEE